jgi:3'(2'), 5'-bisphosphate nucleotidase
VTEESFDGFASPPPAPEEPFWLVDPLDGTKEFLCHRDEFTVNIALIIQRRPVLGVVYVPARGELYSGAGLGTACLVREDGTRQPIAVVPPDLDGLRVVSSLSHGNPEALACFLAGRPVKANIQRGSSLKFCSVARGEADLYPRLGPTCEWDTAAGHAVLEAAGGTVLQLDQTPLLYGKFEAKLRNPHFIAVGG